MAEWSNVPDSKSGVLSKVPRVRIPPSPPISYQSNIHSVGLLGGASSADISNCCNNSCKFILLVIYLKNLKSNLIEVLISFLLYGFFAWVISCFPQLKSGPLTFYLFIPAGVKLFSILIFSWRGAIGIGLGTFVRLLLVDPSIPWGTWLIVSLVTTSILFLAIELALKVLKIDKNLSNINYYQIVILAVIASVANGVGFMQSVNFMTGHHMDGGAFHHNFLIIMANFAGNALFVCALVVILKQKRVILGFISRLRSNIK